MISVFKEDVLLGRPKVVVLVHAQFKKRVGRTKCRISCKRSFCGLSVLWILQKHCVPSVCAGVSRWGGEEGGLIHIH